MGLLGNETSHHPDASKLVRPSRPPDSSNVTEESDRSEIRRDRSEISSDHSEISSDRSEIQKRSQ
ncbi:hypothetical protein PN477_12545 [Spirulina subsalsa CS-330]|nr:hypothetical protein [Spirulina subsalsa CS-330]